ncbi:hypothetical protein FZC33_11450 [Labrys sp. KNU-23]|uniref:hypothetical protein n=1 Tax=Labrys sp. KNU-23 TaxID=2789216 RepID=UPI0011ECB3B1|nr:hypothetical protein [Labrys sp. KNU-23]QEN86905.1 hypothetical protein FZC33_11450 [Labrys sp. KNU-23]
MASTYIVQAVGSTVMLTVTAPGPAWPPRYEQFYLSVAQARDIAADMIEAADKADANPDRAATLRNEITRLVDELNGLEGAGSKTCVVGIDFGKEP